MHTPKLCRLLTGAVLLLILLSSVACSSSLESMTDQTNASAFLDCVLENRPEDASAMLADTIQKADFEPVFRDMRTLSEGATSYRLDVKNMKETTAVGEGKSVIEQTYIVALDNGRTFTYRIAYSGDSRKITGLHFRDVTDFLSKTDGYLPMVNIFLGGLSLIFLAFRVWMIVDCLRRKMNRKVLWVIILLLGATVTLTVGDHLGLNLGIAFLFDKMSMQADPLIYALILRLSIPVGSIVYFFVRKRLTLVDPLETL